MYQVPLPGARVQQQHSTRTGIMLPLLFLGELTVYSGSTLCE